MVNVARGVIESRGVGALYRGFGITMLRAFPVNGVIFPTYELVLSTLKE
jgi:solute carrier family 25 carnitine/acylcarnitine transporter 20/29